MLRRDVELLAARLAGDGIVDANHVVAQFRIQLAIPWEERSLRRSFGEPYLRYMREVRWRMIPFIY